ncbi:MAG: acyl-CoA dehydrogenase family protein [Steroidobacteraceae bacterium]
MSGDCDELALFRATVAKFVAAEMVPNDAAWREQRHVGPEIWRRAGELGLLCADVPTEYGGAGGTFSHEAIVHEELARRAMSGFGAGVHSICAHYLLNHGTDTQKRRWLPRLARGELIGAVGMSEPGAGSDLQAIRTRAVRDGDSYLIDGSKLFITNGFLAGLIALAVKTDPSERAKGISILMVETHDLPGYRVGRILDKMGLKSQDTAELFFDGVRVPADHLLGGEEGCGFAQMMSDLPYERMIVAVTAVAAMEGAIEETIRYVKSRKAFGRTLLEFQNSRFALAEAVTLARVARVFVNDCVARVCDRTLDSATAAMAKWWATDMQQQVLDTCVQLHGGYGYMNEYQVCRMFADARVQRIYGGTNEIMKELIARSL